MDPEKPDGRDEHGGGRPANPLGRRLEDVSHLFLSGASAAPLSVPPAESAAPAAHSAARAAVPAEGAMGEGHEGPRLLHRCPAPDRQQLVSFLGQHIEALEAGLRPIDAGLPCDGCGEIDLLATDGGNRLAIVDVETGADDRLLLRGLAHFDWTTRNVPNLRRMYRASTLDLSLRPRVILIAPRLSWMVRCAAQQISAPRITWCIYRAVAIPGGVGIVIEPDRGDP